MTSLLPVKINNLKWSLSSGIIECNTFNCPLAITDIFARNCSLRGASSSQTSVMVQRDISPNDNLKNLAREKSYNWPQKRKNNIGNSRIIDFIKGNSSDLDQITI